MARITNRVKNQELQADVSFSKKYYEQYGVYPYTVTTLCLGEKKSQYDAQDPKKAWRILDRDLRQMLEGISLSDAQMLGLRLAYEPRWIIGADTIPADVLAKIDDTHAFIKEVTDELLGQELMVDYGAAVKEGTIESIMKLPHVNGVLIGSAANDPATLKPVILKAVAYAAKTGKSFNLGVNWKASDSTSGLKELSAFIALFKGIPDLDKIQITIGTPNVREARTAMDKVENYFSKVSLTALGVKLAGNVDLGNGFSMAALAQTEKSLTSIESFFSEHNRDNDHYRLLRKDGIVFALAKENVYDQMLMTVPVADMTDSQERDAYYANLLETVSLLTSQRRAGIELIEEKGDRLKSYLSRSSQRNAKQEAFALGALSGTKYWYGRERFFQMEYKPAGAAVDARSTMLTAKTTERPLGRGVSFIIQPTYTVLINGYGTIGAKAAAAARRSGFLVMVTARSVKVDSRDAFLKDYPVVLSDTKNAADFEKHGMQVAGDMMEVLDIVDFVIDATPAKVGADNIKNVYSKFPHLRVIVEGGEKAAPGIASFSSGTNYETVRDSNIVRVVSCNTTAMARTFGKVIEQINEHSENLDITNLLMRRAADPGDEKGENPDGISLLPVSHHGDDLRAVLSEEANSNIKSLRTTAVVTPTTHYHVHSGTIRKFAGRGRPLTAARVQSILEAQSRVALVRFPGGELKTPVLFDIFNSMIKDANHPFIVVAQVEESGNPDEVAITIAVPQESNVVPENVNALQSMSGLWAKDAAIRLVNEILNIDKIKDGLEKRLPAQVQKDGGDVEAATPIDYMTLDDVDSSGRIVLYRGDFNSPVKDGKLSITERMRANAVTIKELQQKGAKVVIMVHQGRKGDADYLENLQQYSDLISELIGAPVGYVDDLYGVKAVNAIKSMKNGDVAVLKNVRSWEPETEKKMTLDQQAQSAMVQGLQPWIDFEVLDAFSIAHRNNISVVGFTGIPLVAGRLMEKEIKGNYRAALVAEKPYIASFGGAKIDDYLGVIRKGLKENIYTKVHMSGLLGELALVAQGYNLGKPTTDFLEEQFKDFSDKKYGNGMQGMVNAIKEILDTYGDRIEIPIDLAYLDASGKRREVVLTAEHKTKPAADTLIGDIGTQTANKYAAQIKEAKTVFVKGPWGNYKNIEFIGASDIIAKALSESKAYLITGGGDTNVLFERLGMTERINYFSLAGGAFLEFMEGKALPGLVALDRSAKAVAAGAQKVGVSKIEFLKNTINDKFVFVRRAGDTFTKFISGIVQTKQKRDGVLSQVALIPEIIKDSRGKSTVRVTLKINGIEVKGEVPAGASKGEDEAATVTTEQAIRNIEEVIVPLLKNSGLDISTYEGLRKAEQLIIDAAGENFKALGANATVPVSWALWRAAAALNNMKLWQYIRANEPGAIGEDSVYFYMNIYNGGLHALRAGEKLGVDRIDIQEIMIATVVDDSYGTNLKAGDKTDKSLKAVLLKKYVADAIMRADEAGFSVKGLGLSTEAIALVLQAIRDAGFEPGKDIKLALDVAATSFYNTEKKVYEFQGKELTSEQMVQFYIDLVEQYPGIILSIEDGMAENDWAGWALFTAAMKARDVLTIGDDVFVTQHKRLQKGIEENAATAILIKVNQNGTVGGTLDVMKTAKQNGMKAVVSHRSGETLDDGIADLAYATRALGLKTGDPQPEYDFPDSDQLVRRNKYLRMVEIQEKEAVSQKALIVGPEFFAAGGSVNALKEALALNKQIQVVLYGENAESIKALLADVSILTAPTLTGAVTMLKSFDFSAKNIVLVGSAGREDADAVKDIQQIPVKGIGTIALAQALNALLSDEATQAAFAQFDRTMADFSVDAAVSEQVDQAIREEEEFFNKV
ncbi:MAG: type II glyceraldehyde-3-phosphate dehydrogenase [Candidatus Omnitrophota bacterium]